MNGRSGRRAAVLVTAALMLLLAACGTAERRYKTLSFFFDGVPVPAGMEPETVVRPGEGLSPFRQSINSLPRPEVANVPQIVSVHEPYQQRQCNQCHSGIMTVGELEVNTMVCDKCHEEQRLEQRWNHGPINLGTCVPCHQPHNSIYPHLLDQPVPDLCLYCHDEDFEEPKPHHDVGNLEECTLCHDPHRVESGGSNARGDFTI